MNRKWNSVVNSLSEHRNLEFNWEPHKEEVEDTPDDEEEEESHVKLTDYDGVHRVVLRKRNQWGRQQGDLSTHIRPSRPAR